jgi:hypothetical protein
MKKDCIRCGAPFEAERHLKRYCSDSCRQYAYLERNGLKTKASADKGIGTQEKPVLNSRAIGNLTPVNDVIYVKRKTEVPVQEPILQEKKSNESPDPVIDRTTYAILKDLIKEVRLLKEQVAALTETKKQELVPVPKPPMEIKLGKYTGLNYNEKLQQRMSEYFGENMFTEDYFMFDYHEFKNVHWVNERWKSHIKAIIKLQEQESMEVIALKNIYDKIEVLRNSYEYNHLPAPYPYRASIDGISKKLLVFIDKAMKEDLEEIDLEIGEMMRVELQAMIKEIGTTVPDVDHSSPPPNSSSVGRLAWQAAKRRGLLSK